MRFIILLIALGLECGLHIGLYLHRFNWFNKYLDLLRSWCNRSGLWQGFTGVAFVVIPLLFILGIIYAIFHNVAFHLIRYLIALIVLVYCLGPYDFYDSFKRYFLASETGNEQMGTAHIEKFLPAGSIALNNHRATTAAIFENFNQSIFAIVFWFAILGPLGALLYRSVALTKDAASKEGSPDAALANAARCSLDLLDWIPVRLLALGYALVGDFMPTFKYWLAHVLSGVNKTDELNLQTGLIALNTSHEDVTTADLAENKSALDLVNRTLVIYVVVLALIVIGMII